MSASFSQVTFIEEVSGKSLLSQKVLNESEFWYYTSSYIYVYSQEITLVESIYLSIIPTDVLSVSFLSKNLFTNSGKYEFIVKDSSEYLLFNDVGELLYNFGDFIPIMVQGNKFFTYKLVLDGSNYSYTTKVYSLGGNLNSKDYLTTDDLFSYPNPAKDFININYHIDEAVDLSIYSVSGQKMQSIKLDPLEDNLQLNLSVYKPGLYIYIYNNKSGKFIVK
jgi:hypothetical protein